MIVGPHTAPAPASAGDRVPLAPDRALRDAYVSANEDAIDVWMESTRESAEREIGSQHGGRAPAPGPHAEHRAV